MYEIHFTDQQQVLQVEAAWVEEILHGTLQAEQVAGAEIAVALLDDAGIHLVNREHLQHDYPTDVISFLYAAEPTEGFSGTTGSAAAPRGAGLILDGEILVSTQTAARVAAEVEVPATTELALYIVHGLLHLCGYDDHGESERQLMRSREREILTRWDLVPCQHE